MTNDDDIYVLEMGYRLDGDTMFIPYKELLGTDLVKYITDYSLTGKSNINDLPPSQKAPFERCACSYMLWTHTEGILSSIGGLEDIATLPGVTILQKTQPGTHVDRYRPVGNILFVSDSCEEMCKIIAFINEKIKVLDNAGNDILIRFTDFDTLIKNSERQC